MMRITMDKEDRREFNRLQILVGRLQDDMYKYQMQEVLLQAEIDRLRSKVYRLEEKSTFFQKECQMYRKQIKLNRLPK